LGATHQRPRLLTFPLSPLVPDSSWWDRPAYEPYPRCHSGLLGDDENDYDAQMNAPQHMPWAPPLWQEAQVEEVPVEEYMPSGLSKEETI
jgi:hypothetical protein